MRQTIIKQFFSKLQLFSVALAALLTLLGCVQELNAPQDNEPQQVAELVKLNLTIGNEADTKAVKSAWEEGDNIYLYFLEESDTAFEKKPSAVITYNDGEWVVSTPADQEQINSITESGYIFAQYIAGPRRTLGEVNAIEDAYGEIQQVFSNYTLESNVISATLNLSQVCSQIVITNLNAEDGWIIESPNTESYTSFNSIYNAEIAYSNEAPQIKAVYTGFESPKIYGVANADGVAFYANTITNNSQPVKIILRQAGSPISYSKTFVGKQLKLGKAYKLGGPEIDESGGLIRANGWETVTPSNKIIFTRTSPEVPFPIAGTTAEYFGANLIKTEYYEAEGFGELVFDGPVTKIGVDAFKNNAALTSVTLPNGITEINDYAFYRCTNLSSVNLPNELITIGKEAFCECTSLESIAIPRSVTTIGGFAFYNSIEKNIISYKMAESAEDEIVAHYSSAEYWGANYVDAQYQKGTGYGYMIFDGPVTKIGDGVFADLNYFESITIPSSVTTIGERAFYNCDNLTSISIPENVTSICNNAFSKCHAYISIYFKRSTPPEIQQYTFGSLDYIYVPRASVDAYKTQWEKYKMFIEPYDF